MLLRDIIFAILLFGIEEMFDLCFEEYEIVKQNYIRRRNFLKKHMGKVASVYRMGKDSLDKRFLMNIYLIFVVSLLIYGIICLLFYQFAKIIAPQLLPEIVKLWDFYGFIRQVFLAFVLVSSYKIFKQSLKSFQEKKYKRVLIKFLGALGILCFGIVFVMFN